MSELKPCPFCGGTKLKSGGNNYDCGIRCQTCEASGPNQYGNYEWNTRAAHTAVEVLDLLVDWLKASPFDKIQIANVVKKIAALRAEKGV